MMHFRARTQAGGLSANLSLCRRSRRSAGLRKLERAKLEWQVATGANPDGPNSDVRSHDENANTPKQQPSDTSTPQRRTIISQNAERQAGEVVLKRYEILGTMGEGANGTTYRARDTADGTPVAVKELALGRLQNWKQFELFEREAATLRSLSHPNIPKYLDYQEVGGCFFLVQELADGPSLSSIVRSGSRLDEDEVERIARELLTVVKYLSSRRPAVVHRDIKPENIVLEGGQAGGRVLLVDFGGVQDALTHDANVFGSTIVGTAGYMPPEQFGGNATVASDLYSMGGVLLFLLSGRTPGQFRSQRLRLSFENEVPMRDNMRTLLRSLLEPIAEDRCSVQEALDILDGKAVPSDGESGTQTSGWIGRRQQAQQYDLEGRYEQQDRRPESRQVPEVYYPTAPSVAKPWRQAPTSKPAGSRITTEVVDDLLLVDIPPDGFGGVALLALTAAGSIFSGGFAVVWNAFVAVWTVGAAASGGILFALFSIPFWFAGATLARDVVVSALLKESLQISGSSWSLTQELAQISSGVAKFVGGSLKAVDGDSRDLQGAKIVTTMIVNGEPRTAIELQEGVRQFRMGEGLQLVEQEWLVGQINRHLERGASPVRIENDLYPSASAQVVNDSDYERRRWNRSSWDD